MTQAAAWIDDAKAVRTLADPMRRQILKLLSKPGSAVSVARELGMPRQRVGYHMRELEKHGFVELLREERKRGCTERIMRRTSESILLAPDSFAEQRLHPQGVKDRFSNLYLIATATQMLREASQAEAANPAEDNQPSTFSLQFDVRLATPQDRTAFMEDLGREIAKLAVKYHQPQSRGGRPYRVVIGSYPAPQVRQAPKPGE